MAHVILVSAQGPNPFFPFFEGLSFDLGDCWDTGLDLDQGLTKMTQLQKVNILSDFTTWILTFFIEASVTHKKV